MKRGTRSKARIRKKAEEKVGSGVAMGDRGIVTNFES